MFLVTQFREATTRLLAGKGDRSIHLILWEKGEVNSILQQKNYAVKII